LPNDPIPVTIAHDLAARRVIGGNRSIPAPRTIFMGCLSQIVLTVALSATLADPTVPKPPELALEDYKLPNGLKVALHRDTLVPRVTVAVAYHVGSKNEKAGRTGFAHFFEHMMFRGTRNVPNYDIPLKEAGASANAFTNNDMTIYHESVPSNFLERALYLEAERLAFLPSALEQGKFDTEREVVKNERRQGYENRPYGLDVEAILANLFPKGHPYSWSVIGSMDDLNKATLDDLKEFFAEFYHPANATLCLAGDFDTAEAKALIAKYFGALAAGPKPKEVTVSPMPANADKLVRFDRVQLPRVYWTWPAVAADHSDAPALDLLARVLGGGETSRLHQELVLKKRVSTDVSGGSSAWESGGLFMIDSTAVTGAEPDRSLAAIESAFDAALREIKSSPPTADEVTRALALFEAQSYARLTSPLSRAVTLATGFAQKDDPRHYQKEFSRRYAVTPADLTRVARTYLTPEKVVVWTQPADPGHPRSEAAKAGPSPSPKAVPPPALSNRAPVPGLDWSKMPAPSTAKPFREPSFVRKTLSNEIDVWCAPWKTLPVVSVELLLPSGTADDPIAKSGLARLTTALLDKGTMTLSATELGEALEKLGVTLSTGSSSDETTISWTSFARNLEPSLKVVTELLVSPRFDPKDFEREQALALANLVQGPSSVAWLAGRALPVLIYGSDHPYANPADGYAETVKGLTLDDVKSFHAQHIGPKGASLIVVGDVEPDRVLAMLDSTLGKWTAKSHGPARRPSAQRKADPTVIYLVDKPGAAQSVLNVGRPWVDRSDPGYYATLLGNRILGGDFLSRLNQNLREKNGFAYGARSGFGFRRSGSLWTARASVRTDATAAALKEVLGELDRLTGSKPFLDHEIAAAVGAEVKEFPDHFQSPRAIAATLREMAEFHLAPDYLETFIARVEATKSDEIGKAMANLVAKSARVILIVGDRKVVEPKLRALGYSKLQPITYDGRALTE
jgi:zinc protease